jgi:hypothetical protein
MTFNVFNHRNHGNPGFGFTQGANTSAATVVTATPSATSGQIDGIVGDHASDSTGREAGLLTGAGAEAPALQRVGRVLVQLFLGGSYEVDS